MQKLYKSVFNKYSLLSMATIIELIFSNFIQYRMFTICSDLERWWFDLFIHLFTCLFMYLFIYCPCSERKGERRHLGSLALKRCWNIFPAHRIFSVKGFFWHNLIRNLFLILSLKLLFRICATYVLGCSFIKSSLTD